MIKQQITGKEREQWEDLGLEKLFLSFPDYQESPCAGPVLKSQTPSEFPAGTTILSCSKRAAGLPCPAAPAEG